MLELARSWVDGWTVSRRAPKPVDVPWGLSIQVGLPAQAVRHVLLDADVETARGLVGAITEPATCIKAFLEPDVMEPWFSPEWEPTDPGFLMAVDLRPSVVRAPDGYTATAETADDVISVRILAAEGELAARGQIGLTGAACVFDQIVTEEAHQRLGLGTVVMGALTNAAIENGAATGILGATVQGRALYETLDWKVLAPLTGFIYKPVAP
ncbi:MULTISPECIES: GNAT family N-acetyltransferase [unclassified Streptomyces]|uniref:GNAT family N-acetyltransferase n=1 Tax=unclassified Streptomyces TaxID=2593676 RepID=UPI001BE6733E|nr:MULTISPECIES: GNAT family N-acetyltransferase [unclassified Streptomyces]MBT2404455.1 GNAT family N-acetyltransferase [Streptomyces sp. ISL-21]MBT2612491.1 GNAT family N-acetyltransferase [Streptomyces sp. ISL-87]